MLRTDQLSQVRYRCCSSTHVVTYFSKLKITRRALPPICFLGHGRRLHARLLCLKK
ncbi:hypothetical protein A167_01272 [Alcanivorax sp. S71-1-4]|nr:hypothetical protein A167_01272 [Alcanivorax sp. S71-1-4]